MRPAIILLLLFLGATCAPAQLTNRVKGSDLRTTNRVDRTNYLILITNPGVTNGNAKIRDDDYNSNRTFYGQATFTNLFNGRQYFWLNFTNSDALTNVVWSYATASDKTYFVEVNVAGLLVATGESVFGQRRKAFKNTGGNIGQVQEYSSVGPTTDQATWTVVLTNDTSTAIQLKVSGNGVAYRAAIEITSSP